MSSYKKFRIRYATLLCFQWIAFCTVICILVVNELRLEEIDNRKTNLPSLNLFDTDGNITSSPTPANLSFYCPFHFPCEYYDDVDFRIIVIVYNRFWSLKQSLNSINKLNETQHCKIAYRCQIAVEIWIDQSITGTVSEKTRLVAEDFVHTWQRGPARVHLQPSHAGMEKQWIFTWRPQKFTDTSELALIVEDDIDLSPYSLHWLALTHHKFGNRSDVAGYTLQMQNVKLLDGTARNLHGPESDNIFMYPILGTWGFAPHPASWRTFQDWYLRVRYNSTFKPYVDGLIVTHWYKYFEQMGQEENIWDLWHHYYTKKTNKYCIYPNIVHVSGRNDTYLSKNRLEPGLHFDAKVRAQMAILKAVNLMKEWNVNYERFPLIITKYTIDGKVNLAEMLA